MEAQRDVRMLPANIVEATLDHRNQPPRAAGPGDRFSCSLSPLQITHQRPPQGNL